MLVYSPKWLLASKKIAVQKICVEYLSFHGGDFTLYNSMLTVIDSTGEYNCTVVIQGPVGRIRIQDLVWCPRDRPDILEILYWEAWAVLQGAYHCCFSIPGKVSLLQE